MAYMIYGNSGGIDEVLKLIENPKETFDSLTDVFDRVLELHPSVPSARDLFIGYYCRDERIGKDVYIIGCAKSGSEDYMRKCHWPQFVSYMVEV